MSLIFDGIELTSLLILSYYVSCSSCHISQPSTANNDPSNYNVFVLIQIRSSMSHGEALEPNSPLSYGHVTTFSNVVLRGSLSLHAVVHKGEKAFVEDRKHRGLSISSSVLKEKLI